MAPSLFSSLLRPSTLPNDTASFICQACRRNASSFRRTRKALRVKPDPSFAPSKTEPTDHIIFNPPSSAPNVYHTPSKFLPASDPRRKLHTLAPSSTTTPPSTPSTSSPNEASASASRLRSIRPQYEKKYHLGREQIDEIRRLREEDPRQWTRVRLAEKFECSQFFVSLCCSAPAVKKEQDRQLEAIKRRWGRRKTEAREERKARKALWGRDA
ncbi:uncharacterized protein LTR77_009426 [Saxophila tyrrhenica]|uniref:Uncharacterized protein n=1 Tax=Saxophila tyrrhenica TaxID=1690608 RepID=A0AAV9NXV6_9PEZI|nr:hypothetical protein LTR77_009426 [Saxophila tyrrhenica]